MNHFMLGGVLLLLTSGWVRAEGGFLGTLKPGDYAAAGLNKLTPEERAHLQALAEQYKNTPSPLIEPTHGRAKTVAPPAPNAQATVVLTPGTKIEYTAIQSTIEGDFEGWKPGQILILANGQRWRVSDDDRYYIRRSSNPAVEITPSKFGGYWMKFPALKARVRVELVGQP